MKGLSTLLWLEWRKLLELKAIWIILAAGLAVFAGVIPGFEVSPDLPPQARPYAFWGLLGAWGLMCYGWAAYSLTRDDRAGWGSLVLRAGSTGVQFASRFLSLAIFSAVALGLVADIAGFQKLRLGEGLDLWASLGFLLAGGFSWLFPLLSWSLVFAYLPFYRGTIRPGAGIYIASGMVFLFVISVGGGYIFEGLVKSNSVFLTWPVPLTHGQSWNWPALELAGGFGAGLAGLFLAAWLYSRMERAPDPGSEPRFLPKTSQEGNRSLAPWATLVWLALQSGGWVLLSGALGCWMLGEGLVYLNLASGNVSSFSVTVWPLIAGLPALYLMGARLESRRGLYLASEAPSWLWSWVKVGIGILFFWVLALGMAGLNLASAPGLGFSLSPSGVLLTGFWGLAGFALVAAGLELAWSLRLAYASRGPGLLIFLVVGLAIYYLVAWAGEWSYRFFDPWPLPEALYQQVNLNAYTSGFSTETWLISAALVLLVGWLAAYLRAEVEG